ncbi:MAG TPA: DUF6152 family protein [Vicinamibacterales bacterium]|nr:DUF6152 family protein [Vicinamibacterales bacterium]
MQHRFAVVLVAATLVVVAGSVSAHHSVSGQYDASRPLTLTGVISKVDWINPHIYLHLDVKEKDGAVTTWTLSTLPTAMMRRAGLTKESLQGQPGEVVTITAIAARDETKKLGWISKITYADGHHVQLGRD